MSSGPRKKLQIKLLSRNGELLNVINCLAGQVTVFRAASEIELGPYQRALLGVPGPERFVIEVDGTPFKSEEHELIGFGHSGLPDNVTVAQYLSEAGVPAGGLEALLISYGLEHVVHYRGSKLSPDLTRRVQLLAACHRLDRVIILNDPFEPISSGWRERFAELVVSNARAKKQIVIVTRLSLRPEGWIDNEHIARVQVGETTQRTIGFGSTPTGTSDLLKQVRELVKDEKVLESLLKGALESARPSSETSRQRQKTGPVPSLSAEGHASSSGHSSHASQGHRSRGSRRDSRTAIPQMPDADETDSSRTRLGLAGALLAILPFKRSTDPFPGQVERLARPWYSISRPVQLLAVAALVTVAVVTVSRGPLPWQQEKPPVETVAAHRIEEVPAPTVPAEAAEPTMIPEMPPEVPNPPVIEAPSIRYVLDAYPDQIRHAVLGAFESEVQVASFGRDLPLVATSASGPAASPGTSATNPGTNLFALLETVSESGKDIPDGTGAGSGMGMGMPGSFPVMPPPVGFDQPNFAPPPQGFGQPPFGQPPGGMMETEAEAQEKRERIHQKFLEAIRKAAERRQQERGF